MIPKKLERKDVIVIEPDKVLKLFEWRDNNKDIVRAFKPILTDVVIEVGGLCVHVEEVAKAETFRYSVYDAEKLLLIEVWNRTKMSGYTVFEDLPKQFKENPEALKDYRMSVVSLYASLMTYMEHNREVVTERTVTKQVVKKKGKNGKNKKKSVSYLKRTVYDLPNIIQTSNQKREYNKPDYQYTVRGHWRHYKSGKQIWVPSYDKNKDKPKREAGKTYKFT